MDNEKAFLNQLRWELTRDEGYRSRVYFDSVGIPTIGVGWNLQDQDLPDEIIDQLLNISINQAYYDTQKLYSDFDNLNNVRKRVLINMCFNLGKTRLRKFRKMWTAIELEDWNDAAKEMLDSKWANQVGIRAKRLAEMMKTGNNVND